MPDSNAPKVQVRGRFGEVNQIALDTNRPSLQSESLWRACQMVSFASRDIYLDALVWILTPAFAYSSIALAAVTFMPPLAGDVLSVFLLLPVLMLLLQVATHATGSHGFAVVYRVFLLVTGLALAIVPMYL